MAGHPTAHPRQPWLPVFFCGGGHAMVSMQHRFDIVERQLLYSPYYLPE